MGNGAGLGEARGKVTIDASDFQRVAQSARDFARQMEQALKNVDASAKKTQNSIESLSSTLSRLGGAIGIVTGLAAVSRLGQFALQADQVATAYRRQSVAAVNLAGSQRQLNDLLATYERVTGGAIDRAQALADVTMLQAIGFADTTEELERFVTAARGISVATGRSLDFVIQQLQLSISNQSVMRLDQIGLGVSEVQTEIERLKSSTAGLTTEMAYQEAVLSIAERKFGALTKSAEAQATGAEKARRAWADLSLEVGEAFGPATSAVLDGLAQQLQGISGILRGVGQDAQWAGQQLQNMQPPAWLPGFLTADPLGNFLRNLNAPPGTDASGRPAGQDPQVEQDQHFEARRTARIDFARQLTEIEKNAGQQRVDATRQFEQQRAETISSYGRSIVREAEDFGRQRLRAQQQFERQISDMRRDAALREQQWLADLAERIADLQADSTRRLAEAQADTARRIAEAQEATNKRIAEIERDYHRDRERAERDHRDRLMDAAARLDAVAVFNEQRQFRRQQQDAEQQHRERIDKEHDQLAERVRKEQESLAERTRKEQESLQERIAQEQRAHAKRLTEAREADERRIADMRRDFAERQRQEDEDRAVRLRRMAEDHQAQLAQMAASHADRLAQIDRQATEERRVAEDAHLKEMQKLGGVIAQGWLLIQEALERAMLERYKKFEEELKKATATQGPTVAPQFPVNPFRGFADGGPVHRTGIAKVHAGEFVLSRQMLAAINSATAGRVGQSSAMMGGPSLTLAPGAIVVNAAAGQSEELIGQVVVNKLAAHYRSMGAQ